MSARCPSWLCILTVAALVFPADGAAAQPRLPADAVVVLLDPGLRFERLADDSELPVPPDEQQRFKAALSALARQELERRGVTVAAGGSLEGDADTLAGLHVHAARLGRGQVTATSRALLAQIAERQPGVVILAQFLRVKEGPGGGWNAWTGAIASTASTADVRAALIAGATGEVLAQDAVLHRGRPRPDDEGFQKAAQKLFASLAGGAPRKGGPQ
jgi:hypothetical protein